jgi:hypothetical protein
MCENNKTTTCPLNSTQVFDYVWKYYDIHVSHRRNVLNFLLIGTGLFAHIYAGLNSHPKLQVMISVAASGAAFGFLALDWITAAKIWKAKYIMSVCFNPNSIEDSLQRTDYLKEILGVPDAASRKRFYKRDIFWTISIEAGLACFFLVLALRPYIPSSISGYPGEAVMTPLLLLFYLIVVSLVYQIY